MSLIRSTLAYLVLCSLFYPCQPVAQTPSRTLVLCCNLNGSRCSQAISAHKLCTSHRRLPCVGAKTVCHIQVASPSVPPSSEPELRVAESRTLQVRCKQGFILADSSQATWRVVQRGSSLSFTRPNGVTTSCGNYQCWNVTCEPFIR